MAVRLSAPVSAIDLRHYAKSHEMAGSIPDEVIQNPSGRTVAFKPTTPIIEMSTRNFPGGKGRPARKADNLTNFCQPIV
jgi:hypothetical protein